MAFNSYKFGLKQAKIAPFVSGTSWGTPVEVTSVQLVGVELQTVNGVLNGNDRITDTHAIIISGQVTLRFGFKNLDVYKVITGFDVESSASDRRQTFIAGERMPYFGLCGRIDDTQGDGDDLLFAPKIKLMEGFSFRAEYGQYNTPELTCMCIQDEDDDTYGALQIVQYMEAADIAFPPAWS
jgi:hypothetical protein